MCASAFTIANPGRVRRLVLLGATRGLKNQPAEQRLAMLRMREDSIAQGLPNGRLVVIDGVGHLPKVEAPAKCCALIDQHLA